MGGPGKRRKAYKPKGVNPDAMNWAMSGAYTIPAPKRAEILSFVDQALDKLRRAEADRDDWNTLANALNIAEALVELEIGTNLLPVIKAGEAALLEVGKRMCGGARSTCRGTEIAAICEALDMYRIQLRLCSQAEFSKAVNRVKDLHRSGAMDDVARIYNAMIDTTKEAA